MPKDEQKESKLIDNQHLFPRSEYYARFEGTTAFAMDNPAYWNTYHRSESTRHFHEAGGRKQTQFSSPCIKKPLSKTHSFFAHTGGYRSPFNNKKYSNNLKSKEQAPEGKLNVRDKLLLYKNHMAKVIVESFEQLDEKNEQKIKCARKKYCTRPIAYTENGYPCVLVSLPALNSVETKTEAAEYWEKHPKVFQRLLLSTFIAILNVEAIKANIPIEMVIRASFGHNLPSVCETDNTFRINIGIIPTCYAKLIGKALYKLNQAINKITDENSRSADFSPDFLANVRIYNAKKLKKAIEKKPRYKKLRNTDVFKNAESSNESFKRLHKSFQKENKDKKRKGGATFIPVDLKDKTVWQVIRQAGDSMGKSVLAECFREKGTEDWFANQVMKALLAKSHTSIETAVETALVKLLKCMSFGETVTMKYKKIHKELKSEKFKFKNPSFTEIYKNDAPFSKIVTIICDALLVKRPSQALYAVLERAGTKLFSTYRGSEKIPKKDSDFGSDSDFSDSDFVEKSTEALRMSHVKLRVCSGMKAILLAQYGARYYLRSQGVKNHKTDCEQMYYEVDGALKCVEVSHKVADVKAKIGKNILHFDLNHCNANNAESNKKLSEKLKDFEPTVVILDYTSSSSLEIRKALQKCFSYENVNLVLLVDSGLKNNQGGLDFNPYGEVRVCARDRKTKLKVAKKMKLGLSEEDKLSQKAHEMVRVCKRRGMAFSLYGLFKSRESRFQIVEEKTVVAKKNKF